MSKETFTCRQTFEAEDMNGVNIDEPEDPSRLIYSMPASSPMREVAPYDINSKDNQSSDNHESGRVRSISNTTSRKSKRNGYLIIICIV